MVQNFAQYPELSYPGIENSFDLVGITKAVSYPGQDGFQKWLDKGYHAGMHYLQKNALRRLSPESILPHAKSLILVGLNYYQPMPLLSKDEGRIARYAWGRDYHHVLGDRLEQMIHRMKDRFPGEEFRWGVDATPLSERTYAFLAGMGFIGKNHLLIHKTFGSWFFLGEIITTLDLPAHEFSQAQRGCGSCTKCLDACPTQALVQPFQINTNRCISYLTIENKREIPEELREKIGDRLFGCDLCQEVCPHNQNVPVTKEENFLHT